MNKVRDAAPARPYVESLSVRARELWAEYLAEKDAQAQEMLWSQYVAELVIGTPA